MKKPSFRKLLKKQFPPSVVTIHSLILFLVSIIIIPLLIFTDKLNGKEFGFIIFLIGYFTFVLFITGFVIYRLYKWNFEKKKLLQSFKKEKVEIIENKRVDFNIDVSFTDLRKFSFGNTLKSTQVGFESCDMIKIEDSLVIFGKGFNNVVPTGKIISRPFEINYKNQFRTDLNRAYLLKRETKKNNTSFILKVNGLFGEFNFEMTVLDYLAEKTGYNNV